MKGLQYPELTDLQNAPVNGQRTLSYYKLPSNRRIHFAWIRLALPAGKVAQDVIETIDLLIGTKVQRQLTPERWHDLLTLDGAQYGIRGDGVPGGEIYIPFQFSEPYRETPTAKENYALDLVSGVPASIRLQFRDNAAQPTIVRAGAIVEDLDEVRRDPRRIDDKGRVMVNYDKDGVPFLAKYYEVGINPGGTKPDLDTQLDPIKRGDLISLTLYNPLTAGSVDRSILKLSNNDVWDRYKADNDFELDYFGITARAGRMDLITDILDRQSDALDIQGADMKLRLESAAGMTGGLTAVAKVHGLAD